MRTPGFQCDFCDIRINSRISESIMGFHCVSCNSSADHEISVLILEMQCGSWDCNVASGVLVWVLGFSGLIQELCYNSVDPRLSMWILGFQ